MNFSEILASIQRKGDEVWTVDSDESWTQGRSLYGGLQGVMLLAAMQDLAAGLALRTLQVSFLAPVPAGATEVRARILRRGANTVHAEARIVSGEQVLCQALGIFGAARSSQAQHAAQAWPRDGRTVAELPFMPALMPGFMRHFGLRWLQGPLPGSGSNETRTLLDVSLRDSGGSTPLHLPLFADVTPPMALAFLDGPAPGSSMTWMLEVYDHDAVSWGLKRWIVEAEVLAAQDGYTTQSTAIRGADGRLIALGRQSMVIFG
jgi:acyl-CoA thioesterase